MCRAPWKPSSPGWNMNRTSPASSPWRPAISRAAPASIAVCVSCPQACIRPATAEGEAEPGLLVHRQRVHVAAQQHRASRSCPAQDRDGAGAGGALAPFERQVGELGADLGQRQRGVEPELGVRRGSRGAARRCAARSRAPVRGDDRRASPSPSVEAARVQLGVRPARPCNGRPQLPALRTEGPFRRRVARFIDEAFRSAGSCGQQGDKVCILYENRSIS